MFRLFRHKKILLLNLLLIFASFSIACISIWMIYKNAQSNLSDRLTDIVNREKSAIMVWRNNYHASDTQIISYLQQVRKGDISIGKSGEIVVAREKKDSIEFIIGNATGLHIYKTPRIRSLEAPMFEALEGKDGFVKSRDYKGVLTYASYTYVKDLNWGIVAKIPASEIDVPYIKTAILVFFLCTIIISFCSYAFIKITNPMIEAIFMNEQKVKLLNAELRDTIRDLEHSKKILEENRNILVKLNDDKDKFIAILAHDLISPFNAILGFLGLLSEKLNEYSMAEIKRQVSIIYNSAQNTYHLIEDILTWARAEAGNLPFRPQTLSLSEFCDEIVLDMRTHARAKDISVHCGVPDSLRLEADKNMIKIILRNLVSNAIKFTNKGGHVRIDVEQDHETATIIVSDNGIGIDIKDQKKLWDISQKFTTIGTANEKGTGLGLLLCKEFVNKHGGRIWVESELGEGSIFKFTIPLAN
jgi:signal transduction histidine kinase